MKTEDKILIGANPAAPPMEHSISLTFAVKDQWWRRGQCRLFRRGRSQVGRERTDHWWGRKVRVRHRALFEAEKKSQRQAIAQTILQTMKKMKPKD